jgi:ligand-binding SRPBCC domain-containing protein
MRARLREMLASKQDVRMRRGLCCFMQFPDSLPAVRIVKRALLGRVLVVIERGLMSMAVDSQVFVIRDQLVVGAPIERCFALSTHLAVVEMTLAMRPVGGRLEGVVVGGDTVRWRGWKWGLRHDHESLIEAFDPPRFFRDRMIAGRFAAFEHDHQFTNQEDGKVLLQDEVRFAMRWGAAGLMIGRTAVVPHVRKLVKERFALIRRMAEGQEWRGYVG